MSRFAVTLVCNYIASVCAFIINLAGNHCLQALFEAFHAIGGLYERLFYEQVPSLA